MVEVTVQITSGKLAGQTFNSPRVVSRFDTGRPHGSETAPGKFVFTVSAAGHYSVELFGQAGAGLRDALLVFIDAGAIRCPSPAGGGKLYRYTGPNVPNPTNPSWSNTGYYAFDALELGTDDGGTHHMIR